LLIAASHIKFFRSLLITFVAWTAGCASAAAVPEPPRRPVDLDQKATAAPAAPQQTAPPATPTPDEALSATSKCLAQLQQLGLRVEPGLVAAEKNEACVIDSPVQLQSLRLGDTDLEVAFPDHPVLACSFAERFGGWVRDLAAPWMAARISPLRAVRTGPGFVCRNRNHQIGGKLSAHASGLAVDIASFELANGEVLSIAEAKDEKKIAVLATLRTAACGWFTTILGPGSDAAHATHWHLDIERHGSSDRYRICQ